MKESFGKKLILRGDNRTRLYQINEILEDYKEQGYTLTLRQLYYQLVSKDIIPNKVEEYQKISTLLNKGRMSGYVDWTSIEDRVRVPKTPYFENSIKDAFQRTADSYRLDRHKVQDVSIEVWIEKDALSQIIYRAIAPYGVTLMVNRGYSSASAMYESYKRIVANRTGQQKKKTIIFYLGDHDPSGLDMIRDITERLTEMLVYGERLDFGTVTSEEQVKEHVKTKILKVKPLALTTEQVNHYAPPPNPAKLQDPRAKWYVEKFGYTSWEVDALPPKVLNDLVVDNIIKEISLEKHKDILLQEARDIEKIKQIINNLNTQEK